MLKKMLLLEHKALQAGFVPVRGEWVKTFPSGTQWVFSFQGDSPIILDKHGRLMRDSSDGISAIGMLLALS